MQTLETVGHAVNILCSLLVFKVWVSLRSPTRLNDMSSNEFYYAKSYEVHCTIEIVQVFSG